VVTLITATFLLTLVVSGGIHGVWSSSPESPPVPTCGSAGAPLSAPVGEYLNLTIHVDAAKGVEYYTPANFTLPARTLVRVTITNYDAGSSLVSSPYSKVCGTVNGTETVGGTPLNQLPRAGIAHTFTITNGTYAGFNIPVPPATARAPSVVTFEAYFDSAGTYRWQCEANCGETQMSLDGQMSGLVTVR
jgi:hypothetical protein